MPYFVMEIFATMPGLPGLFVACAFSGTLRFVYQQQSDDDDGKDDKDDGVVIDSIQQALTVCKLIF